MRLKVSANNVFCRRGHVWCAYQTNQQVIRDAFTGTSTLVSNLYKASNGISFEPIIKWGAVIWQWWDGTSTIIQCLATMQPAPPWVFGWPVCGDRWGASSGRIRALIFLCWSYSGKTDTLNNPLTKALLRDHRWSCQVLTGNLEHCRTISPP